MPYITKTDRHILKDRWAEDRGTARTAGELNYLLSQIINAYMRDKGKSYQTMNDIIGVLEALKMEFYRRIVADYEDMKMAENGDVFSQENLSSMWSGISGARFRHPNMVYPPISVTQETENG